MSRILSADSSKVTATDNRPLAASAPHGFDHAEHAAGGDDALDRIAAALQQRGILACLAFAAAEHHQHVHVPRRIPTGTRRLSGS